MRCAIGRLFHVLPLAQRHKVGGMNDRSYICDAEGWIRFHLQRAVQAMEDPPLTGLRCSHIGQ